MQSACLLSSFSPSNVCLLQQLCVISIINTGLTGARRTKQISEKNTENNERENDEGKVTQEDVNCSYSTQLYLKMCGIPLELLLLLSFLLLLPARASSLSLFSPSNSNTTHTTIPQFHTNVTKISIQIPTNSTTFSLFFVAFSLVDCLTVLDCYISPVGSMLSSVVIPV